VKKTKMAFLSSIALLLFVSSICLTSTVYGATSVNLSSPAQTETTVTLSWTQSDDWVFEKYNVTFSTSVNGPYYEVEIITDKGKTSTAIVGLNPNTDYYFIVYDSGSLVGTTPSNTLNQKTKQNPKISITSRTESTVSLKWIDYNTYSSQVPFESYVIQISTSGGQWSTLTTITDVSQSTYTVTGLSPATYGFRMYDKVGTSGQHTSTSDVATLTIHTPVEVHISSSATTVNVGQQVQLTATASGGTNSYSYQWYSNGNPISGATSASYSYSPTETGTTNIYATAEDTQDSFLAKATSNSITLTATSQETPPPTTTPPPTPDSSGYQGIPIIYIVIIVVVIIGVVGAVTGLAIKRRQGKSKPNA